MGLAQRFEEKWNGEMSRDSYVHPEHVAWDIMELVPIQRNIGDTTRWGHIVEVVFHERTTGEYIELSYEETSGDSEIDAFGRGAGAIDVIPKKVVKTVFVKKE